MTDKEIKLAIIDILKVLEANDRIKILKELQEMYQAELEIFGRSE